MVCGTLAGSMRMLMDGRLVALPEEERRLMRTAAAMRMERDPSLAALHASEGKPRAGCSYRTTTDSETHGQGTPDSLSALWKPALHVSTLWRRHWLPKGSVWE